MISLILSGKTSFVFAKTEDNIFFTASSENFAKYIPKEVNKFARDNYIELILCAEDYKTDFQLTDDDFIDIKLGEPFCIYKIGDSEQKGIYYYPLINSENQFILLMTIIDTNHSMQYCLSNEFIDILNQIDYYNIDYVFYEDEEDVIAQSCADIFYLYNSETETSSKVDYYDIHRRIISSMKSLEEINIEENSNNTDANVKERYTRSFSTDIEETGRCVKMFQLCNAQGQFSKGMCWAASVATMVNYINGSNISAMQVCNLMNIGYDEGGDIYDKKAALLKFGLQYHICWTTLNWDKIQRNIDMKMPIAMSATSTDGMHAVTLVGYRIVQFNRYIAIWDSASNGGNGAMKIINYSGKYTTFRSDVSGPVFTWIESLYYYN